MISELKRGWEADLVTFGQSRAICFLLFPACVLSLTKHLLRGSSYLADRHESGISI